METIRVFICFELSKEVTNSLRDLIHYLKTFGRGVRWVRHDGIHLTLKFIGEIDALKLDDIAAVVENVVKNYKPFKIKLSGKGAFPNLKRPKVFWIGISDMENVIKQIQVDLEDAFEKIGLPREERGFSPHLTLGRVKFQDPTVSKISLEMERMKVDEIKLTLDEVVIMQSELQPNGALYTPLRKIKIPE
jgi:RNA 2',3'-cyclic 3'-phosphodiesterase